ncbi:MAG: transketolase C-terminal domain-containing protein, partial [Ilumatobacteraceae bacterium]
RYPKGLARNVSDDEVGSGVKARKLRSDPTNGVCILAIGKLVGNAEKAAEILINQNINISLWDVRSCVPADPEMIHDAAQHRLVITVEDGIRDGGIGMLLADAVTRAAEAADAVTPHIEILGIPIQFIPHAKPEKILAQLDLDAQGIANTVTRLHSR